MRKIRGCAGVLAVCAGLVCGQARFEVASVKQSAQGEEMSSMDGGPLPVGPFNQGSHNPDRITWTNIWLERAIQVAYGFAPDRISGPAWMKSYTDRYDIVATVPRGTSVDDFKLMVQNLLEERFKLTVHRETKEVSGYALEVGKGGAKLKVAGEGGPVVLMDEKKRAEAGILTNALMAVDESGFPVARPGNPIYAAGATFEGTIPVNGRYRTSALNETMAKFAELLGRFEGAPVQDRTGLTGAYDIHLEFVPNSVNAVAAAPPSNDPGADLLDAVQTLGLRLTRAKAPVETLVVDRAERAPTGN